VVAGLPDRIPPLAVLWKETDPGGLLDPLPHRKGARGEQSVGQVLESLDDRFRVHHGIETGRGNVDHLVIGPTGVFAIETKNVAGRFELRDGQVTRDGYDARDFILQARAEAMAIRDRLREEPLGCWVEALLVSGRDDVQNDRFETGNVTVLSKSALLPFILNRRIRLSEAEVNRGEEAISGSRRTDPDLR
jgi:hypothetical protein